MMIDLSFIGKNGVIFQWEEIVSMYGFNVIRYLKSMNTNNDKISSMSTKDILLNYINRETEDISVWMKKEFDVDFNIDKFKESTIMVQPNWLYSHKVIQTTHQNRINSIIIHSDFKSEKIKYFIDNTYNDIPIQYTYGDIVPVINAHKNHTYITSSVKNITRCLEVKVPFALTIVDDFMYVADILVNNIDKQLKEKNVYVMYTSILSSGLIS